MTGSFSDRGVSTTLSVQPGGSLALVLTEAEGETFDGVVQVQRLLGGGGWAVEGTYTDAGSATLVNEHPKPQTYRVACTVFAEGSDAISYSLSIADEDRDTNLEVDNLTATESADLTGLAAREGLTGGVYAQEIAFTEDGAGTYAGAVDVPAGATLLDIIVNGVALWTAATSAALEVGDGTDPDGYFTAVNLKATDLLAGESLSFSHAGGKAGAYIANSHVSPRFASTARTITASVVSVGAGTAGRTRVTVVYHVPVAADIVTATKAA